VEPLEGTTLARKTTTSESRECNIDGQTWLLIQIMAVVYGGLVGVLVGLYCTDDGSGLLRIDSRLTVDAVGAPGEGYARRAGSKGTVFGAAGYPEVIRESA
jgi:hypothetical protein